MPFNLDLLLEARHDRQCYEAIFFSKSHENPKSITRTEWEELFENIRNEEYMNERPPIPKNFQTRTIGIERLREWQDAVLESDSYPKSWLELQKIVQQDFREATRDSVRSVLSDNPDIHKDPKPIEDAVLNEVWWKVIFGLSNWIGFLNRQQAHLLNHELLKVVEINAQRFGNPSSLWFDLPRLQRLGQAWDKFLDEIGCSHLGKNNRWKSRIEKGRWDSTKQRLLTNSEVLIKDEDVDAAVDDHFPYPNEYLDMSKLIMDPEIAPDLFACINFWSMSRISEAQRNGKTNLPSIGDVVHEFYLIRIRRLANMATQYLTEIQEKGGDNFASKIFNSLNDDAGQAYQLAVGEKANRESRTIANISMDDKLTAGITSRERDPLEALVIVEERDLVNRILSLVPDELKYCLSFIEDADFDFEKAHQEAIKVKDKKRSRDVKELENFIEQAYLNESSDTQLKNSRSLSRIKEQRHDRAE